MANENALVLYDDLAKLILSGTDQLEFNPASDTVDWAQVAEAVDPQGKLIPAKELTDQTFAIRKMKPFVSMISGAETVAYWVVAEFKDGTVFNTVLGGQAVVEELDKIMEINRRAKEAWQNGDVEEMQKYISVGAGRRPVLTLGRKVASSGRGYYIISRDHISQP